MAREEVGQGFTPGSLPCSVLLGSRMALFSGEQVTRLSQAPADSHEPSSHSSQPQNVEWVSDLLANSPKCPIISLLQPVSEQDGERTACKWKKLHSDFDASPGCPNPCCLGTWPLGSLERSSLGPISCSEGAPSLLLSTCTFGSSEFLHVSRQAQACGCVSTSIPMPRARSLVGGERRFCPQRFNFWLPTLPSPSSPHLTEPSPWHRLGLLHLIVHRFEHFHN